MTIEDEIADTFLRIKAHRSEIDRLNERGRALALECLGLKIGDDIIATDTFRRELKARVTGVLYWWADCRMPIAESTENVRTCGSLRIVAGRDEPAWWRKVERAAS
jgi:hypothetical protein